MYPISMRVAPELIPFSDLATRMCRRLCVRSRLSRYPKWKEVFLSLSWIWMALSKKGGLCALRILATIPMGWITFSASGRMVRWKQM